MRHMDVLLAKLFCKALQQCPQCMLPSQECAGHNIPSNTRHDSCEDQRPSLPLLINLVGLESLDNILQKCEHAFNVRLCHSLDVLWGDVEEWFSDMVCGIVESDTDGLSLVVSTDSGISGIDIHGIVGGYREQGGSPTGSIDLIHESLERVGTMSNKGNGITFFSKETTRNSQMTIVEAGVQKTYAAATHVPDPEPRPIAC